MKAAPFEYSRLADIDEACAMPAAIANASNDAIRPLGISINTLPIKVSKLGDMIADARARKSPSKGN